MTAFIQALSNNPRQPQMDIEELETIDRYWQIVRAYYAGVDGKMTSPNTTVFQHEMPGGQYTNLRQQAKGVGLGDRWPEVCRMYAKVNEMFGDVIKVTPSSKVVGDMTLFMVQNNLTEKDIYERGETMDFPKSVVDFFDGKLGVPEKLQKIILRGEQPHLETPPAPIDQEKVTQDMKALRMPETEEARSSYCIYPKVYKDYIQRYHQYGDLSILDTPTYFFGMKPGEESWLRIGGKMVLIRMNYITPPSDDGFREIQFEVNGMPREIRVRDKAASEGAAIIRQADPTVPGEVAATLSGSVLRLIAAKGDVVKKGDPLMVTEAMKMETTITAPIAGIVKEVCVAAGSRITSGDLLAVIE